MKQIFMAVMELTLVLVTLGPLHGSTINFDDASVNGLELIPWDHYQSLGVVFIDGDIPIRNVLENLDYRDKFVADGGTLPNAFTLNDMLPARLTAEWMFVFPGTSIPVVTNTLTLDGFDTEEGSLLGMMTVFNIDGDVIDSLNVQTPIDEHYTFVFNAPGIHRVRLTTDIDGALFDNMTFNVPPAIPGDANIDGKVDVTDLGILTTHYGTTGGAEWGDADFNGDEDVDVTDLGILASYYGTGTAETVPEPGMLCMLFVEAATLLLLRRK